MLCIPIKKVTAKDSKSVDQHRPSLLEGYVPNEIGKLVCFSSAFWIRYLHLKAKHHHGRKQSNECLTYLQYKNMNGTEKLLFFII